MNAVFYKIRIYQKLDVRSIYECKTHFYAYEDSKKGQTGGQWYQIITEMRRLNPKFKISTDIK